MKMRNKVLNSDINVLGLDNKIIEKLRDNKVNLVNELWVLGRKDLKDLSLSDAEINQIIIKLQLNGVDLNKKIYTNK